VIKRQLDLQFVVLKIKPIVPYRINKENNERLICKIAKKELSLMRSSSPASIMACGD